MKNILRFASLLIGAVVLFACEIEPAVKPGGLLQLKSDVSLIKSNGQDTVKFSVIYDTLDVTSDGEIFFKDANSDQDAELLMGTAFATDKEGLY